MKEANGGLTETASSVIAGLVFLAGLGIAYLLYIAKPQYAAAIAGVAPWLHRFWFADWGFDWFYDRVFVQPFIAVARINRNDFVDAFYTALARVAELAHGALSATETGRVRWYAAGIASGAVILVALAVLL